MKHIDDLPNYAIGMIPAVNQLADVLGIDREQAKQRFVNSFFEFERRYDHELRRQREGREG